MTRDDAMAALKANEGALRSLGATSLSLFGSTVRDAAQTDSDLDVLVDYDPASRFNAFDLIGIKLFLESALRAEIDVATRDALHPRLREQIEQAAVCVF